MNADFAVGRPRSAPRRSSTLARVALAVLLSVAGTACATPASGDMNADRVSLMDLSLGGHADGPGARDSLYATDGLAARGGLQEVGRHDARVALWIVAGVLIAVVVFVDLILLPFSYRRRHMFFPCCRYVVRCCH